MDKKIRPRIRRLTPFPHHVVETKIELVVGKHLLRRLKRRSCRVLIRFGVIDLECREEGVFETDIDTNDGVDDGAGLVCFERGGDGEVGGSILQGGEGLKQLPRRGKGKKVRRTRLRMYTSLRLSIAPIMTALPFGSAARYCPGMIRLEPERPYVS